MLDHCYKTARAEDVFGAGSEGEMVSTMTDTQAKGFG